MKEINMEEPALLELGILVIGIYVKGDSKVWGVCLFDKFSWDSQLGFAILK
jgi:hypothetical protein